MAKQENTLEAFLAVAKALSDESRARALLALRQRELCLCQLVALLGLAPSTVSKHMSQLKLAGLVTSRKQGRWVYYRLAPSFDATIRVAQEWTLEALVRDPIVREDAKRLRSILRQDPAELCRQQGS